MSGKSPIQWTEATWNPVVGCTRVSAGCDHCYAFELHDRRHVAWKRGRWPEAPTQYHQPFSRVQLLPERLGDPLRWRKPRRVFVNSMSDLFHPSVPDEFIERVFGVMALTPQHTFQILTKRPERMRSWMMARAHGWWLSSLAAGAPYAAGEGRKQLLNRRLALIEGNGEWPLPNVWLGTSVENQASADERIPHLLATPAAVRFLSCEPLLGEMDLQGWLGDVLREVRLDWVIIGGESGNHARRMDLRWATSLIDQCEEAGVPFFVKQLGSVWAKEDDAKDRHGGNEMEWPDDFRVRMYPEVRS